MIQAVHPDTHQLDQDIKGLCIKRIVRGNRPHHATNFDPAGVDGESRLNRGRGLNHNALNLSRGTALHSQNSNTPCGLLEPVRENLVINCHMPVGSLGNHTITSHTSCLPLGQTQ